MWHSIHRGGHRMRRAIWIYNCEECMNIYRVGFCPELKKKPHPDKVTGFDPLCPRPIIRGHLQ